MDEETAKGHQGTGGKGGSEKGSQDLDWSRVGLVHQYFLKLPRAF